MAYSATDELRMTGQYFIDVKRVISGETYDHETVKFLQIKTEVFINSSNINSVQVLCLRKILELISRVHSRIHNQLQVRWYECALYENPEEETISEPWWLSDVLSWH